MGGQVFAQNYAQQPMGQNMPGQAYGQYQPQVFQQPNPGMTGQMGIGNPASGQNVLLNSQAFNLSTEQDYAFLRSQIDNMYNGDGMYQEPNHQNPGNNNNNSSYQGL
jgi:hypothetical protein